MKDLTSGITRYGWAAALVLALGAFVALSLQVHTVNTEIQLAERQIVRLKHDTLMLETELQARANQRQLAKWNRIEFGYEAPRADQYLESERQLASLGAAGGPLAPRPIRVARSLALSDDANGYVSGYASGYVSDDESGLADVHSIAMVSPVTGRPITLRVDAQQRSERGMVQGLAQMFAEASPIQPAMASEPPQ